MAGLLLSARQRIISVLSSACVLSASWPNHFMQVYLWSSWIVAHQPPCLWLAFRLVKVALTLEWVGLALIASWMLELFWSGLWVFKAETHWPLYFLMQIPELAEFYSFCPLRLSFSLIKLILSLVILETEDFIWNPSWLPTQKYRPTGKPMCNCTLFFLNRASLLL